MHVNEQNIPALRRALRTARYADVRVRLGKWIYTDFVPDERARKLYHRLARIPYVDRLGICDIFAEARRP